MLIKSDIDFIETNILAITSWKYLKMAHRNSQIIALYNPPNSELSEIVFTKLSDAILNYAVCGDLNSKTFSIGCFNDEYSNGKILILEQILVVNYNGNSNKQH